MSALFKAVPNAVLAFSVVTGCYDTATAPQRDEPGAPVDTAVALSLLRHHPWMKVGSEQNLLTVKLFKSGLGAAASPHWSSSDAGVVAIAAGGGAVAVSPGTATITATDGPLSASITITVYRPGSNDAGPVIVEDFTITESPTQTSGQQRFWSYGPQLRIRAVAGRRLTISEIEFRIQGLAEVRRWPCFTGIPSREAVELNGELYGDWAWAIETDGVRASRVPVLAIIKYLDETFTMQTVEVEGPVVEGTFPTSGQGSEGACHRG